MHLREQQIVRRKGFGGETRARLMVRYNKHAYEKATRCIRYNARVDPGRACQWFHVVSQRYRSRLAFYFV
jgi:hypothetical protein